MECNNYFVTLDDFEKIDKILLWALFKEHHPIFWKGI
jgi:hypothetical protein